MLYQIYDTQRALMEPFADLAQAAAKALSNPLTPMGNSPMAHRLAAGYELLYRLGKDYEKPEFNLRNIMIGETEVAVQERIKARGCQIVDTTCGDVMSVWKRVRQYANDGVTSIIHGKSDHEETRATSSRARSTGGGGHFMVVYDLEETDFLCAYLRHGGDRAAFLDKFRGAYSEGFDPDLHLRKLGVANQTTMLRSETEEVQRRIRAAVTARDGAEENFRVFDTICGATQERQDALLDLLSQPPDLMLVVGGYNSSNTAHLADMAREKLPTYFVLNAGCLESTQLIRHFDTRAGRETTTGDWLPAGPVSLGITAGASCPSNLIEDVLLRVLELSKVAGPAAV